MAILATLASSIEGDKENIKPTHHGRSAAKLDQLIHTERNALHKQLIEEKALYERKIQPEELQDLDDPLEPYLNYIKWIRESYPTGSNDALLIHVLEKTTHDFKDDDYYRNEVRYFKVWLDYISYSDHPGDVYNYLLKKQIGSTLALFYECYSQYFELNDQWEKAESILKLGITNKARPTNRLMKSYEEFKHRKELKGSILNSSTSLKMKGLSNPDGNGLNMSSSANLKSKPKMQIFKDDGSKENKNGYSFPRLTSHAQLTIDFLDTVKNSKKENVLTPTSWVGQTLNTSKKSQENSNLKTPKRKMEVFNENSVKYPITKLVKNEGKPDEIYDLNIELFLPTGGKPRSKMEVLLMFHRKSYRTEKSAFIPEERPLISNYNTPVHKKIKSEVFADGNDANNSLCDQSPQPQDTPLLEYFKNSKGGMFSAEDENDKELDRNKVESLNETNANTLANQYPKVDELPLEIGETSFDNVIGGKFSDIFADTVTKSLNGDGLFLEKEANAIPDGEINGSTSESKRRAKESDTEDNGILSSPFVENPNKMLHLIPKSSAYINPYRSDVHEESLNTAHLKLSKDSRFHDNSSMKMNKLTTLQKLFQPNGPAIYGNKDAIIEFEKGHLFCVIKALDHKQANSKIFLAEKMDGKSSVIKVNSSKQMWEAYILMKINSFSNSFSTFQSFYQFYDESYLLLPYYRQGNLLEFVNCLNNYQILTAKKLIDEQLIFYLTIQIIANVTQLHSQGIIHGNVRPENYMLDFQQSCNQNKLFFNGLALIDFTKAIDTSLYPPDVKFICDVAKKDPACCREFSNNLPWVFEPDYHGVANVIHLLLFNSQIKVKDIDGNFEIVEPIKRYWQTDFWNELFSVLLNPKKINPTGDVTKELTQIKEKFESWFSLTVDKRMFITKLRNISEILDTKLKKGKN